MQLLQFLEALVWMVTVVSVLALDCAAVVVAGFVAVAVVVALPDGWVLVDLLCAIAPNTSSRAIMVTSSFFIFWIFVVRKSDAKIQFFYKVF